MSQAILHDMLLLKCVYADSGAALPIGNKRCKCPLGRAGLSFDFYTNAAGLVEWKCYSCKKRGDVIELAKFVWKVDREEAVRRLECLGGSDDVTAALSTIRTAFESIGTAIGTLSAAVIRMDRERKEASRAARAALAGEVAAVVAAEMAKIREPRGVSKKCEETEENSDARDCQMFLAGVRKYAVMRGGGVEITAVELRKCWQKQFNAEISATFLGRKVSRYLANSLARKKNGLGNIVYIILNSSNESFPVAKVVGVAGAGKSGHA